MFGIDINNLQNKVNYAYSAQPQGQNQYQTGTMSNPDQTSWMAPSFGNDSTLADGSRSAEPSNSPSSATNNTGIAGSGDVAQTRNTQTIPPGDGTAISAVNNGWTFGSYQQTPGWDTGKLNDPNKHDPKYDWLRARQQAGGGADLTAAINFYNSHLSNGEQAAKWSGGDKVDFGAGVGPVDVLFGSKAGINSDLWAPINSDSNFTPSNGNPSFGAVPGQQNNVPQQANNMQARFRTLNPMMQQRLMMNPAIRQIIQQQITNPSPGAT